MTANARPCIPATATPLHEDTAGASPPLAYLGREDGEYVPMLQGSFSWTDGSVGSDASFALQAYIAQGLPPPATLRTTGAVALAVPGPYRIEEWQISMVRWVPEAWTPDPPALDPADVPVRMEGAADPTPAVCFEAPPSELFVSAFIHFEDGQGTSSEYGRLTVEP